VSATPYPIAARRLLRDTLLDAAGDLLTTTPWAEITMAAIAKGAGVSRQTLYNEFGSRQEFAAAYIQREATAFLAAAEEANRDAAGDPVAAVTGALGGFLETAASHPLIRSAIDGSDDLVPLITTHGAPVVVPVAERIADVMLECWPTARRTDARMVADTLVRLAISYATLPAEDPRATARGVATLLAPALTELIERQPPAASGT
jgi:AcrR family transcriptional regulator